MFDGTNLPANNGVESVENNFGLLVTHEEREDGDLDGVIATLEQRVREGQVMNDELIVEVAVALRKHCEHHFHRAELVEHVLNLHAFLSELLLIDFIFLLSSTISFAILLESLRLNDFLQHGEQRDDRLLVRRIFRRVLQELNELLD